MPRKQFIADLKQAQSTPLPKTIFSLDAGEDDGQFEFDYKNADSAVHITAILSDVYDYPHSHTYMIFVNDDALPELAKHLQSVPNTGGKTIMQLIDLLATELANACATGEDELNAITINDDEDEDRYDLGEDEDEEPDEQDDETFLTGAPARKRSINLSSFDASSQGPLEPATIGNAFTRRLRSDLNAVKDAGFRVGILGDISSGSAAFIVLSVRISKLGISDEAMLAWEVNSNEYLTLMLYFPAGYKTIEQLQGTHSTNLPTMCTMRLFQSKSYKPSRMEAISAFMKSDMAEMDGATEGTNGANSTPGLRPTFLSKPLARLLNEEFFPIIRFRAYGMDWAGAEAWYRDREKGHSSSDGIPETYFCPEVNKGVFPAIVTADHYGRRNLKDLSFPLVAMQFTLRHFVRCVEFCLVCHRKTEVELEAIKPYVCNRPLCLFQYMAMGFGPSIEHEILSQPYVVDLLISFCYSAAANDNLKDLPEGLGIKVPDSKGLTAYRKFKNYNFVLATNAADASFSDAGEFDVSFDRGKKELQFLDQPPGGCPVSRGSWIVIRIASKTPNSNQILHCRVSDTAFFPIVSVDEPVHASMGIDYESSGYHSYAVHTRVAHNAPNELPEVVSCKLRRHDLDFDTLGRERKCIAICQLLNMLPSVADMQAYLQRSNTQDLKRWAERIPASALQLLQWIIASNRACIMQVDDNIPGEALENTAVAQKQDRLYGMQDYMQFRFAMGAPDKEERFMSEVQKTTRRLRLKYPTIFAWHGSPLHNWHMIIREGLHFNDAVHGRAYGDGVYHAKDAGTSMGYSNRTQGGGWSNSVLKITSAIALNELVNAPAEFISSEPYYVVPQLDWIQTRYLLVQSSTTTVAVTTKDTREQKPTHAHPQDPNRTPSGLNDRIIIPASAIKTGHRTTQCCKYGPGSPHKRLKDNSGKPVVIDLDSDLDSIPSDSEDLAGLCPSGPTSAGADKVTILNEHARFVRGEEDFVPGALEYRTLPLMPMPTYATSGTTKRLLGELKGLQKSLDTVSLPDLGWYIDVERVDNVYQWLVELHSFHTFEVKGKRLPLADDMKQKKVKSVVLEIRFGPDFPFSPPYIRVVRPRFLSLLQGGGGHIVMGGAMCMELLTNTGWIASSSMESVLMQVRLAIASEPFARLDMHAGGDYGTGEAADGFIRACRTHGWKEPPGFREVAYGMRP